MASELSRALDYTVKFYFSKWAVLALFSIPFILAAIIAFFVAGPTYFALGGLYVRTGSIPDLSIIDIILTILGYSLAVFLIADVWTNINLIVKSKRTQTLASSEVLSAMGEYAIGMFFLFVIMILAQFILQIITFDLPYQSLIYPLGSFVIAFLLFFVPPAIVIDHTDLFTAISLSISLAIRKWWLVLSWALLGLVLLSVVKIGADFVIKPYSAILVMVVNSLFILPFLIILQTQMYMEKYPLAK